MKQHLTDMQTVLPPPLNAALLGGLVLFCEEGVACPNSFRQIKKLNPNFLHPGDPFNEFVKYTKESHWLF